MTRRPMTLRRRVHVQLDPRAWPERGLSPVNKVLAAVILIGTAAVILDTEPELAGRYGLLFFAVELAIGIVFAIEYAARVWAAAECAGDRPDWRKRLRFVFSKSGLIDALVIVATLAPFLGSEAIALRLLRLMRLLQLAKLGRLSAAMRHLVGAVSSRRDELALTILLALCLMTAGATALFWLEGEAQPDKFGSIPRALWWAVITLTTIGYGDVFPITPLGKVVAAMVAFTGIGLIAMPTGILAAAFSDAVQRNRKEDA